MVRCENVVRTSASVGWNGTAGVVVAPNILSDPVELKLAPTVNVRQGVEQPQKTKTTKK